MPRYEISLAVPLDRYAVAQEVMASSIRVLSAAGFDDVEIDRLLEQTLEQWRSGEASSNDSESNHPNHSAQDESGTANLYDLSEEYDRIPARVALARLEKRAEALSDFYEPAAQARAFKLLDEAVPLFADAQRWLQGRASSLGLQVVSRRDQWLESASDDDLDAEDDIIFLDDYRWAGRFPDYLCGRLIETLLDRANLDGLQRVTNLIEKSDVATLGDATQRAVDNLSVTLPIYTRFVRYVQSRVGGEYMQSEFLEDFCRADPESPSSHLAQGWLMAMEDAGQVQRYKKSNRWRVAI